MSTCAASCIFGGRLTFVMGHSLLKELGPPRVLSQSNPDLYDVILASRSPEGHEDVSVGVVCDVIRPKEACRRKFRHASKQVGQMRQHIFNDRTICDSMRAAKERMRRVKYVLCNNGASRPLACACMMKGDTK